jgi:1-deoxy-D-xylulose-5-phosphate reductoisomerase
LQDKTGFLEMSDIIAECMQRIPFLERPVYNDYVECDRETRLLARQILEKKKAVTYIS